MKKWLSAPRVWWVCGGAALVLALALWPRAEGAALAAAVIGGLIRDAKGRARAVPSAPPAPKPLDTDHARREAEERARKWLDR